MSAKSASIVDAFIRTRSGLVLVSIVIASAAALLAAFIAELVFGIAGCALCLYQRAPYGMAAAIAMLVLVGRPSALVLRLALVACAISFAAGGAIAIYHVGVQQSWWIEAGVCEAQAPSVTKFIDLHALLAGGQARPACNVIDWSLFGLSLAAVNFIYSGALSFGCAVMAWRIGLPGVATSPHNI
jgi:disulfide bond formation protein DsbB